MRSDRVSIEHARRRQLRRNRARAASVALLIVCGFVAVTASPAEAAPALGVTPNTNLTNGQTVAVSGTGFTPSSPGGVIQCNSDPAQPTIVVLGNAVPVSCTNPLLNLTSANSSGNISVPAFAVKTGTVGPPGSGTDSSGANAATSAAAYPCPPTQAQINAGVTCVIAFGNLAGERATTALSFEGQGTTSTTGGTTSSTGGTTTTTGGTTTTTGSTTTTTAGPGGDPTLHVDPSTDLEDGQKVVVTGSGFTPGIGSLIQCSGDPKQPTVSALGNDVPVSCVDPLLLLVTADANGDLPPTELAVKTGTVGPPAPGTDSEGGDAAESAADYPCPPTQAQVDAGVSCVIAYGNLVGERATADISFAGQPTPPTGSTPTVLGGSEPAAGGGGTLPKTGLEPGLLRATAVAVGLLDLGYLVLSATWTDRRRARRGGRPPTAVS